MSSSKSCVSPPANFPGYDWIPMTGADSKLPSGTDHYPAENLDGSEVRIGRVYDGDSLYIGTAVPEKGVCLYLNKNLEVKTSSNYEILSVDYSPRVNFRDVSLESTKLNFENEIPIHYDWDFPPDMSYWSIMAPAGVDNCGAVLGISIYQENGNTYYGWVNASTKEAHIPRHADHGPNVLEKGFSVMLRGGIPRWALMKC